MKIALAQLNPTIGDLHKNAQSILEIAQQVANQGVKLLLTPELSLCGYQLIFSRISYAFFDVRSDCAFGGLRQ